MCVGAMTRGTHTNILASAGWICVKYNPDKIFGHSKVNVKGVN
jgi:hypothetical protein